MGRQHRVVGIGSAAPLLWIKPPEGPEARQRVELSTVLHIPTAVCNVFNPRPGRYQSRQPSRTGQRLWSTEEQTDLLFEEMPCALITDPFYNFQRLKIESSIDGSSPLADSHHNVPPVEKSWMVSMYLDEQGVEILSPYDTDRNCIPEWRVAYPDVDYELFPYEKGTGMELANIKQDRENI